MKQQSIAVVLGVIFGLAADPTAAQDASTTPSWPTQPGGDQFLASRLKGLDVYDGKGKDIGDIDEILLDQSGKAQAVVLSVSDALGIPRRLVAIPFDRVQFVYRSPAPDAAADPTRTTPPRIAEPGMAATAASPNGTVPRNTALGSFFLSPVPVGVPPELADRSSNVPDRAIINLSADELNAAPAFVYRP